MATGNDGITPPPPPPVPGPPPPPPPAAPGSASTKLPLWSFIFGLASFLQCIPFIAGIVALITGFMGRKRAKELDQGTGLATAGIILGILGMIVSLFLVILLFATGFAIFGTLVDQTKIAQQLKPAEVAAQAYGASHGSYEGLTTEALVSYGYTAPSDITVKAVPLKGGASYCIQGSSTAEPSNIIHVPPAAGDTTVNVDINGVSYRYATGSCPVE